MSLQVGSLLCLATIPFALVNSLYHATANRPRERRWRYHLVNLATSAFFVALAFVGAGSELGQEPALVLARLWLPIVYYWWAYAWAGATLHLFHPPEVSFDRALIATERRWFGNPALWMARGQPAWLNETMNFFYWSYYFYTPALGLALWLRGDFGRFEAMALSVNLGYAICYLFYPWYPLWGPRWALVSEGLLPEREQILDGYWITGFMNRIMWSDTAHKGGAMPSAHSSTCVLFMVWGARVWGTTGLVVCGAIGVAMFVSTVYGRYHYLIDVLVGAAIGLIALVAADALVAAVAL